MHPNNFTVTAVTDDGETVTAPLVCVDFSSLNHETELVKVDMPDKSIRWVAWETVRVKGQIPFEDEAQLKLMGTQIALLESKRAAHLKRLGIVGV
ncbi:hypothetical protein J8Z24_18270 [Pseudoalteromonas sp. SCSIO 43201]|uniref:hypothetical protein n=1 Tax=Pseudoalteromonas sp. SCSIO 43201 TaxID=2822842 RepID=UPI002075BD26|nr:hypothetical protein [Pseudoalteromonas sp. SCSIO 43201]USD30907.1 hypothetical protein J8Z24_18270 [Pseudoalteromonas sp. SCSIO 43201]